MEDYQVIDIRSANKFQEKHVSGSLSLNLRNFLKFADQLLDNDKVIQLIVDKETEEDARQIKENKTFKWADNDKKIEDISVDKLVSSNTISGEVFLKLEDEYILLDVRHPDEITRPAPEKNLVNIPLDVLPKKLDQLDKSVPIYTLCGSGTRATTSAAFLINLGYNAIVVKGGIVAIYKAQGRQP